MIDKPRFMPIIRLDFDGVIHSYTTKNDPWRDDYIPDSVTPGFWQWAIEAAVEFKLVIFSSRCKTIEGRGAIQQYLREQWTLYDNDSGLMLMPSIEVVSEPVPAWVTIDDRGLTFEGPSSWEKFTPEFILNFKPWNK
jgi:hypothetical protein